MVLIRHNETGEIKEYHPDGIFVFIGMQPNSKFLKNLVNLDDNRFVVTDQGLQTSIMGIFSAGDCRAGATNQAISAAGEGASVAIAIRDYLRNR